MLKNSLGLIHLNVKLLLDSCKGDFSEILKNFEINEVNFSELLERSDLFHLIGRLAIRHRNLDVLEKFTSMLALNNEYFYSNPYYSIYKVFFDDLLLLDERSQERLMRIFMNQLMKRKGSDLITFEEYNQYILPSIK